MKCAMFGMLSVVLYVVIIAKFLQGHKGNFSLAVPSIGFEVWESSFTLVVVL